MFMLITALHCAYLASLSYQINFPGGGGGWVAGWMAGLIEIKANSASQQSWSSSLAELGNWMVITSQTCLKSLRRNNIWQQNVKSKGKYFRRSTSSSHVISIQIEFVWLKLSQPQLHNTVVGGWTQKWLCTPTTPKKLNFVYIVKT